MWNIQTENPEANKYESEKADPDMTNLTWAETIVKPNCNGKSYDKIYQFKSLNSNDNLEEGLHRSHSTETKSAI